MRDLEAALNEIHAMYTEALRNRDARALSQIYHAEAKLLVPGGEIVLGRRDIEAFYSELLESGFVSHTYRRHELEYRQDLAYEIAEFTMLWKNEEGGERATRGKHLIVLKLSEDEWKVYADIWNYSTSQP
jgi:ketosteroid isomerase-like protein